MNIVLLSEVTAFPDIQHSAVIERVNMTQLLEDCFEGIQDACSNLSTPEYSCSNTEVAEELILQTAQDLGFGIVTFLQGKNNPGQTQINSSVIHSSTCQEDTEISWTEMIQLPLNMANSYL